MKKISFLIFFIGLFILTSCNYSKVENITTSKTDEIQTTTEVPKKTLTADEVVALFNAKYDLFSENCEFDTDVSIFLFGKDGDCSESSYSEKCKYIDGKAIPLNVLFFTIEYMDISHSTRRSPGPRGLSKE